MIKNSPFKIMTMNYDDTEYYAVVWNNTRHYPFAHGLKKSKCITDAFGYAQGMEDIGIYCSWGRRGEPSIDWINVEMYLQEDQDRMSRMLYVWPYVWPYVWGIVYKNLYSAIRYLNHLEKAYMWSILKN